MRLEWQASSLLRVILFLKLFRPWGGYSVGRVISKPLVAPSEAETEHKRTHPFTLIEGEHFLFPKKPFEGEGGDLVPICTYCVGV